MKSTDDRGTHWHKRWNVGPCQFGWNVYRHVASHLPDRWVFHPFFVYDRKAKP